ncbi:uncharacterized protein TRIADDRAFT_60062 [Trichoplax adhaerens]|uniref:Major facilitator superfamily (MFS) profile domain-containing protein n=1 Tax=Trichoplax adhaerens TaxID=10228 RepID=B3S769_TRIAD|nr:hypothetical protein TRIADDRAFT_60062 [Trichoplax adhaerens]EDV21432.1 hypothetical protein TRIADDRAFT_60062 [Trichoplax adhaerens]|eukprot:XP_002116032.1 hypothetical protein TRIADDRAFT_60062 [Trichoplax adhaerens]
MADEYQPLVGHDGQESVSVISRRNKLVVMVLMSTVYFLISSVYALLSPFFPQVAKSRGVSHTEIGLIFAVYPIFTLLTSPICGILLPRIGVVFALWAGIAIEAGCNILFGFLPSVLDRGLFVAFCLIIRSIQGVASACSLIAALAIVSSVFADNVATATSTLETFSALGLMAGPPIGGLLYQAGGFKLPFIVLGSVSLVIGCISIFFIPRIAYATSSPPWRLMKQLIVHPRVMIISFGVALQMLVIGFLDPTLSLHLKPLNLTTSQIGFIFLALPAGYGLFSPVFGYLSDRFGYRPFIIFGSIGMGISLLFVGPAPFIRIKLSIGQSVPSLLALGIAGAAAITTSFADILEVAMKDLTNDNPDESSDFVIHSVVSGLFTTALSLGQVVGPIVGGIFTSLSQTSFDRTAMGIGFAIMTQE